MHRTDTRFVPFALNLPGISTMLSTTARKLETNTETDCMVKRGERKRTCLKRFLFIVILYLVQNISKSQGPFHKSAVSLT